MKETVAGVIDLTKTEGFDKSLDDKWPIESIIIIGAGLGGLSAAIHLQLAGYRVTIYEANDRVGGRASQIRRDGFIFDTGPSLLNYPWVFEDLFRAAGRNLRDYVSLVEVDPSVSFQWADGTRFTLSSDTGRLLNECERVEPGSRPRMLSFLRDAENKFRLAFDKLVTRNEDNYLRWLAALSTGELLKLSVWHSMYAELSRFFRSRYLREALGSYGMYLGGSPYNLPGLFSILPFGELAYGLWLPKGGIYALVSAVESLAREVGVKIFTNQRVQKIISENQRVTGIELEDGNRFASRVVVSNVDVPTTDTELLDPETLSTKSRRRISKTKMTPGVLTFYWGIRDKVENIGHHTIFLPDDYHGAFDQLLKGKRIPDQLPFYVSVPSATDDNLAPEGCTAMFVLVPTPLLDEVPDNYWEEAVCDVKERVLERLRKHDVRISPDQITVEEIYTPADWQRRFGLYKGSAFGAAHTLFQVGPLRSSNYSKKIEGLYYVGASTTPGTGMPMVTLGGKMLAERILLRSRQISDA
jgi:phytoene desaturase